MSIRIRHSEEKDSYHIPGDGNYATLCCMDGDDNQVDQLGATASDKKINCVTCYNMWITAGAYSARDFAKGTRAK